MDQDTSIDKWIKRFSWGFLLLAVLLGGIVIRTRFMVHPISGTSMEESLHDGDHVLIDKQGRIVRYETIAFAVEGEEDMFVKRVIGVPGDAIIIQNETMIIDLGEEDNFKATIRVELTPETAETLAGQTVIPKDQYFVIGDNTDVSVDSRSFGFVDKAEIEGVYQLRVW
ncbi:signal peptidase I [Enterococcus florum]|nr:signal peptidase I [Enterococcus florum]